ncbi:hypothetical protein KI387_000019, partial [Taxus chinensis]
SSENEDDETHYESLFMAMDIFEECNTKGNNIVDYEYSDEEEANVNLEVEL